MAGGLGGASGVFCATGSEPLGRGDAMSLGIGMGMDSAEKMLRPEPEYSTSSLWASLPKCKAGSMPAFESRCASLPATCDEEAGAPDDAPGWAGAGAGWFWTGSFCADG